MTSRPITPKAIQAIEQANAALGHLIEYAEFEALDRDLAIELSSIKYQINKQFDMRRFAQQPQNMDVKTI